MPAIACEDGHPSRHSPALLLLSPSIFDTPLDVQMPRPTTDSRTSAR
jgi:hypothetical protein